MAKVHVIGLTGGIGSGKSTVATMLGRLGAEVLDADAMVHALLAEPATTRKVVKRFGEEVLDPHGKVDRKKLAEVAFASRRNIRDLEAILHPAVVRRSKRRIAALRRTGKPCVVVIDAPLLVEAGMDRLCDEIVFVHAPKAERVKRVRKTRGWSRRTLETREKRQKSLDVKRRNADTVVRNAEATKETSAQVHTLWQRVQNLLIG